MNIYDKILQIEKDMDETIVMLKELRSADYDIFRDPYEFFRKVENRVQYVISLFEPFHEKINNSYVVDQDIISNMNRLINKYNFMLDLCEPVD